MEKPSARGKAVVLLSRTAGAAALVLAAWRFGCGPFGEQNLSHFADRGEFLFHAVYSRSVSFAMPLPGMALAWSKFHLGADPLLPFRAAGLLACLAAYAIGARGGGRGRGAFFALAAALAALGPAPSDAEQVFYAFSLLVFLLLELVRLERGGFAPAAVAGLAAGFSMLTRSPLFLFPPLAAVLGFFSARGRVPGTGRRAAAALLFLACAYLPVVPWARLNHHLFGRVILFEEARPASNIITGAKGLVFSIEGDARAFAGLSRDESVYPWAVRTVLADPLNYASAVVKRIAAVFMMFPLLFALAAAGLFFCRSPGNRFTAFLAAYFTAVHCLLAVEERYFYPLKYLLALIAAAGAWELAAGRREEGAASAPAGASRPLAAGLFLALALPSAAVLFKVWEYPRAAGRGLPALTAAAARFPADPWPLRKQGEAYLSFGLTAEGLEKLGRACGAHYPDLCHLSGILASERPAYPPESLPEWYELSLVKLLRELRLGLYAEARSTLARLRGHWETERNAVRGGEDAVHLAAIRNSNLTFWDSDVRAALLYWPPEERAELLSRLARIGTLTPRLRCLMEFYRGGTGSAGCRASFPRDFGGAEFDWSGGLREILAALLAGGAAPAEEGALRLLRGAAPSPREALEIFDVPAPGGPGPALKAAAAAYRSGLSSPDGRRAARELYGLDGDNFVYALVWLAAEGNSPAARAEVARRLSARPYPLAAAAAAYIARGEKEKALELARAAARGPLPEEGWTRALLAFQGAEKYGEGIAAASRALAARPRSAPILNGRGMLRVLSGDEAGAREDFRKALAAAPGEFQASMSLGALLERAGEKGEAEALYGALLAGGALDPVRAGDVRAALERVRR